MVLVCKSAIKNDGLSRIPSNDAGNYVFSKMFNECKVVTWQRNPFNELRYNKSITAHLAEISVPALHRPGAGRDS